MLLLATATTLHSGPCSLAYSVPFHKYAFLHLKVCIGIKVQYNKIHYNTIQSQKELTEVTT